MSRAARKPAMEPGSDAVNARAAELHAALNAGKGPGDPAYVWTYGERAPERDHFDLPVRYIDRTRTEIEIVAEHRTLDDHRRYLAVYGPRTPTCRWSYALPEGVKVATDEPEDWAGRIPTVAAEGPTTPGQIPMPWASDALGRVA